MLLPDVAKLAQRRRVVVHAGRRLDAKGVELGRFGVVLGDLGKARDDAAAIAVDTDRAALPETLARLVGTLELAQKIRHHAGVGFFLVVGQALEASHEARPGPNLEIVQHRRFASLFCHRSTPSVFAHTRSPLTLSSPSPDFVYYIMLILCKATSANSIILISVCGNTGPKPCFT